jgi:hypothetical protein
MNSAESPPPSVRQRDLARRTRGGRLGRRLRRMWSRLSRPIARVRERRHARPGPPPRIDKKRHWRGSSPLKRGVRVFVYGGGLVLLGALALALLAVLRHRALTFDSRCQQRALSCGVLASFLVPVLTLALISAFFLLGRLWYLRRRYLRTARSQPQDAVPTAGSVIGDVVGRDELCRVMIADLRDVRTRRPHVVVGGIGTGKTALLVRLTEMLAHHRAVPVAVRLRDAQKSLDFRELARAKFTADLESSILSDNEGEKVWRQLLKEGRIVVLADGLEEALNEPWARAERDNLIHLAISQASKDELPLIIASRPHSPLRGTEAALVELEPLSEEAALDYIQLGDSIEIEQRIDWIVETADVTETPLYLQIARQLHRADLLVYVSANWGDHQLDTRSVDRAELRVRLLETWKQAVVNGHFPAGVALSREDREATIEQLSLLACIGLGQDTLEVKLDDYEDLVKPPKNGHAAPIVEEARKRLAAVGHKFDVRLAATWGAQLQLVEAQESAVRFPHSILQAYLGSRLIGYAMADRTFRRRALARAGRELLIALVMHSRAEPRRRTGVDRRLPLDAASMSAGARWTTSDHSARGQAVAAHPVGDSARAELPPAVPPEPTAAQPAGPHPTGAKGDVGRALPRPFDLRTTLLKVAGKRTDAKSLNLYATALEIDSVDLEPRHQSIAAQLRENWQDLAERDPRTLEHAKLNLIRRFGEAARGISHRRREANTGARSTANPGEGTRVSDPARPAYRQLFEIGCSEPSYSVRLAAAQEIGAGGDDALAELEGVLGLSAPTSRDQVQVTGNGQAQTADGQRDRGEIGEPSGQQEPSEEKQQEEAQRRNIMRAWLAPLLVGSATTRRREAIDVLKQLMDFVYEQNHRPDRERSGLSIEIALAQGFKYAANRRREHPQARDAARTYLAQQAKEMLSICSFWFTRLTLVHALTLWHLPDGVNSQTDHDYQTLVAQWCRVERRRRDRHNEHPFVAEAGRLAVRALETEQPERYMWIDESGVVSKVGSCPAKPHSRRKHNLWIPPSTGWTALSPRAQQLVADVLLLLNLAEWGKPADRERRLQDTNRNDLPPCIAEDRSPLDPGRLLGMAGDLEPGSNCKTGCGFGLCPYPPKGAQSYRQELSEAFCRRQQRLLTRGPFRGKMASWQEMSAGQLRAFWRELGLPVTRAGLNSDDTSKTRLRDRRQ